MRTGTNPGCNYKLNSTCGLCKQIILYRIGLCNKVVCLSHLWNLNYYAVFAQRWPLYRGDI